MSTLLDDLADRGLLENTLVVTLAEFGRTPKINGSLGRDHFASAWSCTLSGCGIKGGSLYGRTDDKCETVVDGEIGAGETVRHDLFGARHRLRERIHAWQPARSDYGLRV